MTDTRLLQEFFVVAAVLLTPLVTVLGVYSYRRIRYGDWVHDPWDKGHEGPCRKAPADGSGTKGNV